MTVIGVICPFYCDEISLAANHVPPGDGPDWWGRSAEAERHAE